jgi:hypothetical protein
MWMVALLALLGCTGQKSAPLNTENLKLKTQNSSPFVEPASDTLLYSFKTDARCIATDHLNHIYLVTPDNTIEKRNERGDLIHTFSDKRYGVPLVDATNPMKVTTFFDDLDILITLDNTLSPVGTLNFQLLTGFRNPTVAAASSQPGFWVYDADDFRIKHADNSGVVTLSSDDLGLGDLVGSPTAILERDNKLYVCDSMRGIHVFDTYLNFEKTIEAPGVRYAEVIEQQLFYFDGGALHKLDLRTFDFKTLELNDAAHLRGVSVQKSRLFPLYADRVEVRAV